MKNQKNKNFHSVQKSLPLAEIRNDCLLMKDGTLRAVLMVSSINFALKSSDEQQAIIGSYIQFLNSLNFPLQIVVQSRQLNIDKYLEKLKQAEKVQINELLKMQIADYRNYISELVQIGDIMSKRFYIVVPYNPLSDKRRSFWSRLREIFTPLSFIKLNEDKFNERRQALGQRLEQIAGRLASIGLQSQILDTQSLIELFYNSYNPDVAESEKVVAVDKIQLV